MKNLPQQNSSKNLIKTISGIKVLYVMATHSEYGPNLQNLFTPLITGVGPVEAAITLTKFLSEQPKEELPDLIISVGSAGSAKLKLTNIYQVSAVSYRDMDATPLGFEKGVTPFLNLPKALEMPCIIPDLPCATLSCGGNIVSGEDYKKIDTDMVEMETFSCLRVCQIFNIPLIGIRGISDGDQNLHQLEDWTRTLGIIDQKQAAILEKFENHISQGELNSFLKKN